MFLLMSVYRGGIVEFMFAFMFVLMSVYSGGIVEFMMCMVYNVSIMCKCLM